MVAATQFCLESILEITFVFQLNVFYESQGGNLFNSSDRFLNAKEIKSLGKKRVTKKFGGVPTDRRPGKGGRACPHWKPSETGKRTQLRRIRRPAQELDG